MLLCAGCPVPCMRDGSNPLTSFPCTLPLPGQTLLLKKIRKYLIWKNELVHLCAPQEGGIQAPAASSYTSYLMAGSSICKEGRGLGGCRQTGKLNSGLPHVRWALLLLHCCLCQLAIKSIKKQAWSAFEGERLASELREGVMACMS